jgi:cell division protein FtsL
VGFAAVSVAIAAALVVGLVTLNAMVAQSSFRVDDLRARVDDLSRHYALLERQAARLSAPERIAAWAERHGMRLAPEGDLHILKVRGGDGGTATGAAAGEPAIADPGPSLKPIVVGDG